MRRTHLILIVVLLIAPAVLISQSSLPTLPGGQRIRADNRYFDILPRIVPANRTSTIEIIPKYDHARFNPSYAYEMTYAPVEQIAVQSGWKPKTVEVVKPENGRLRLTKFFEAEQEHTFAIEEVKPDKKRRVFCVAHVYSLEPDLFALRPYKGEFHMHSHNSDGVESPAYVAAAARRAGLDFMALTDHRLYRPSLQAAEAFNHLPVDLRIFPGEEVHPPDNPMHIVSFGASAGISELYDDPQKEKTHREEVARVQAGLKDIPPGVDPYVYASCVWAAARIRERGGLSMFAHPYWYTGNKFPAPGPVRDLVLKNRVFDVLELVSGFNASELDEMDTNGLQAARYYEEAARGNQLAIAGISDAHGVEQAESFGRFYTICFAPNAEFAGIKASIQGFRSIAVEAIAGNRPRPFGPFRLVKFSHFLLREILPQHDELCLAEGASMLQQAAGKADAVAELRLMQGQVARLYAQYWGK